MITLTMGGSGGKPRSPDEIKKLIGRESQKLIKVSMQIIVKDITDGIVQGMAITGGALPALEDSTIRRKGHAQPLIDKGLLYKPSTYNMVQQRGDSGFVTKGVVSIKPISKSAGKGKKDTPRDQVGYHLQMEGVGKANKKFMFFGISKDAERDIEIQLQDMLDSIMREI